MVLWTGNHCMKGNLQQEVSLLNSQSYNNKSLPYMLKKEAFSHYSYFSFIFQQIGMCFVTHCAWTSGIAFYRKLTFVHFICIWKPGQWVTIPYTDGNKVSASTLWQQYSSSQLHEKVVNSYLNSVFISTCKKSCHALVFVRPIWILSEFIYLFIFKDFLTWPDVFTFLPFSHELLFCAVSECFSFIATKE